MVDGPNNGAMPLLRDVVRDALEAVDVISEGVALIFRGRDVFDIRGAVVGDAIMGAVEVGDTVGSIDERDKTVVGGVGLGGGCGDGSGRARVKSGVKLAHESLRVVELVESGCLESADANPGRVEIL